MENSLTPFHPKTLKMGVSYAVVHPQAIYALIHDNSLSEPAINMATSASH